MNTEFASQLTRAKDLYNDLYKQCLEDASKFIISNKTKNFTQEILIKCRSILDQYYYQEFIRLFSNVTEKQKRQLYFPIFRNSIDFDKNSFIELVKKRQPKLYEKLKQIQPFYSQQNRWLLELQNCVNERHRNLLELYKIENRVLVIGKPSSSTYIDCLNPRAMFCIYDGVIISESAEFYFCEINKVPVHSLKLYSNKPIGLINPALEARHEIAVSFTPNETTKIDLLFLCEKTIAETEKLLSSE